MRRLNGTFFTLLSLLIVVNISRGNEPADPVFRAMRDELDRSMMRLNIPGMPAPYFMSYQVRDYDILAIEARYGAIVKSETSRSRSLYIEMRVGSPEFDNTNYYGSWSDIRNYRERLVEEDKYQALRHLIWFNTDKAYKTALEQLAGKTSFMQTHPAQDTIPDFAPVQPFVLESEMVKPVAEQTVWEEAVRKIAGALKDIPSLQDWNVKFNRVTVNRRYLNSERSRFLSGENYMELEISATTQASDGQRLTDFLTYETVSYTHLTLPTIYSV